MAITDNYKTGVKLNSEIESFFKSPHYQASYSFPYNPDSLCYGNNYDVYDEIRIDDQVKAVMALKKAIVIGSGYTIECENEDIKKYLIDNLQNLSRNNLDCTFEEIINDILSFYDYGFSLSECVYKLVDGKYRIETIKVRPPHTFQFDVDSKGNVVRIIQSTDEGELELSTFNFMHIAYQMEYGNPYGLSDLKSTYTAWKIKNFFIKMYAKYGERFGTPTIHGKFDDSANKEDIDKFFTILKSIQNNTVLASPKSSEIDFIFAGKEASDLYDKAIDKFNLWIARSILVPDLMGFSGSKTAGGSYALGGQQFQLFLNIVKKDRKILAKKITQRILRPLIDVNWGKDVEAEFKFLPYNNNDELELSKLWVEAVKGKVFKPNEDEVNNFRKIVDYPQGEVEIPESKAEPFTESINEFMEKYRDYTSYEKKMDFKEILKTLNNTENNLKPLLEKVLDKINKDVVKQIEDKKIIQNFKPERINEIKPKFIKELNFTLRSQFKNLFIDSLNEAKKELFPAGDRKFTDAEILPEEFIQVIEAESFKVAGDYVARVIKEAQYIILEGIKRGYALNKVLKQVSQ
ncbi:MAG: phage portal protein family protein, partial [Promethearchaeota archaeon]